MTPLLSHYISLSPQQQLDFIEQLGVSLGETKQNDPDTKSAKGLEVLIMEAARQNNWNIFKSLIVQLPLIPNIYAVTQPILKELVFHNNLDAIAHFNQAVEDNWGALADHQYKHRRVELKREVLWRPVFQALANAPEYVDAQNILNVVHKGITTSDLLEIFSNRISNANSLNSAFFEALYDVICAREDCKTHYGSHLLFRFIEALSQTKFAPLLQKMCCSLSFTTVIEVGPSEHHSFPAPKDEWFKFLYDSTYDLQTYSWCDSPYLDSPRSRVLCVSRALKVAQAFEQYNQNVSIDSIIGIDRLRHNVSDQISDDLHVWMDRRLVYERLHNSIDTTNLPTSSRKI